MRKLTRKEKDFLIILFDHRTQFPDGLTLSETKKLTNIAFKTPEIVYLRSIDFVTAEREYKDELRYDLRYKLADGIDKQLVAILISK